MDKSPGIDIVYKQHTTEYNVHYHYDHEIIYISDGECETTVNGKSYLAKKGDVVLICNLENHATHIIRKPYERYIITVSPLALNNALSDDRLCAMFKQRTEGFCHCLDMSHTDIHSLFERMYAEKQNPDAFSDELAVMYLRQIMISLYRNHNRNFPTELGKTHSAVLAAQRYMEKNFAEDIRIEELAKMSFMDKYYFSHAFKEFSGKSPKAYLTGVRLANAIKLISATGMSVSEVCEKSGFSDINNFIRLFKNTFGTTPSRYNKNK